jgi:hypothetical protein
MFPSTARPDPSLLLELNGKTLILKDFTSVLTMRSENQQEILSQFREIYDGKYTKAFGNGKAINWKGKVGLIGASTIAFDKHHAVLSALGERFLLYRTHTEDQRQMGIQAQKTVGKEPIMRDEIRSVFHAFLDQFTDVHDVAFENEEAVGDMIIPLACFCAAGRCAVERDRYNQTIQYVPEPEGIPRLVKQFTQIGMCIALVQGKSKIDEEVYSIVAKIGRDLLPTKRLVLLEHLWKEQGIETAGRWRKTRQIANAVGIPTSTVRIALEDLQVVRLLNSHLEETPTEKKAYEWQMNLTCCEYIRDGRILEEPEND